MFRWDSVQRRADGRVLLLYRHERIFQEGYVRPGMDVLDVGGWGVLAQRLIDEGARCTILDAFTSDQAYGDRVRELPHVVGDVREATTFPPESFDLVTCFETLEHVDDKPAALRNINSWLRPGGWLLGTVPRPGFIHVDDPAVQIPTPQELIAALRDVGFARTFAEPTASVNADDPEKCCTYFGGLRRQ